MKNTETRISYTTGKSFLLTEKPQEGWEGEMEYGPETVTIQIYRPVIEKWSGPVDGLWTKISEGLTVLYDRLEELDAKSKRVLGVLLSEIFPMAESDIKLELYAIRIVDSYGLTQGNGFDFNVIFDYMDTESDLWNDLDFNYSCGYSVKSYLISLRFARRIENGGALEFPQDY